MINLYEKKCPNCNTLLSLKNSKSSLMIICKYHEQEFYDLKEVEDTLFFDNQIIKRYRTYLSHIVNLSFDLVKSTASTWIYLYEENHLNYDRFLSKSEVNAILLLR